MGLSARRLSGECLCGAVEYVVPDTFEYALNCHCSQCRRSTGSAFKPLAGIPRSDLQVVRGNEAIMIYGQEDKTHDVHCGTCGSLLFSIVREGCYAHIPMGTLLDQLVLGLRCTFSSDQRQLGSTSLTAYLSTRRFRRFETSLGLRSPANIHFRPASCSRQRRVGCF